MKIPSKNKFYVNTSKDLRSRSNQILSNFQQAIIDADEINAEIEEQEEKLLEKECKLRAERVQLENTRAMNTRIRSKIHDFFFSEADHLVEPVDENEIVESFDDNDSEIEEETKYE